MKLALLCTDLNYGGIQRVVVTLASALAEGAQVALVLLRDGGPLGERLSPRVKVVSFGCSKRSLRLLTPASPLLRFFKEWQPDLTISFGGVFNRIACRTRLLYSLPQRLAVSERNTFSAQIAGAGPINAWRQRVRSRFLYRQAQVCACVSQGVLDDLLKLKIIPPEKGIVIYNPVWRPEISTMAALPADEPWLDGPEAEPAHGKIPVILGAGRLMPQKDFLTLIRAFALLRWHYGVEARLLILGDGEERARLESEARSLHVDQWVQLRGYVDNPYSFMARSSLFVLSSLFEGLPNVLTEALACGCNVVATDCPSGPREILENGKWGRIVPVGDDKALAAAINESLRSPLPADDLRRRAAFFSLERSVAGYRTLIEDCLNGVYDNKDRRRSK